MLLTLELCLLLCNPGGLKRVQACKEAGITQQTYYRWRKEYGGLKLEQARRLKELEKENSRLRRLVTEKDFLLQRLMFLKSIETAPLLELTAKPAP